MMKMEGENEMIKAMMVWSVAVASLHYCHFIGDILPKGRTRLCAILPVIILFLLLPLSLSSITLGGPTTFFLVWLSNFKLLLFSSGQGPLSSHPPLPKPLFISIATLPIKITQNPSPHQFTKINPHKSSLNLALKSLILSTFVPIYANKDSIHLKFVMFLYSVYLYICLETVLIITAVVARALLGLELEPQFDQPYLATSLQDFWGRRWNLMVSSILRPTVYKPVTSNCSRWIGKDWAQLPAIVVTFLVSGLMHEMVFYYIGRHRPTWEVTCFFFLQGVCLAIEVLLKKASKRRLPAVVSKPLTLAFVAATTSWLFMPALLRCQIDDKARREFLAVRQFFKQISSFLFLNN
ncbi:hypothetical protein Dsin_018469 [Dipteronia sinensis]|uniref:Wax synthase domain-containing protein n=1 Tax=Dipteronia sinensis TaxID=43782 RepID=A0AAE0A6T7_9ROSI|nr:hypothetical protein Dsin_018469 [Dipteronia sinensis]